MPRFRPLLAVVLAVASARAQSPPAFAGPLTYPLSSYWFLGSPVELADLDGDGRNDVIARGGLASPVLHRFSNPNGSLGPEYSHASPAGYFFHSCIDFGDGTADFVYAPTTAVAVPAMTFGLHAGAACASLQPLTVASSTVPIPLANPTATLGTCWIRGGTLMASTWLSNTPATIEAFSITTQPLPSIVPLGAPWQFPPPPPGGGYGFSVCNLDGDPYPDFVLRTLLGLFGPTSLRLVRGTSAGFVDNVAMPVMNVGFGNARTQDLTGDGLDELIVVTGTSPVAVTVWVNQGLTSAAGVVLSPLPTLYDWSPREFTDVDGDGDTDILASGAGGQFAWLFNDGSGALTPAPAGFALTGLAHTKVGDLDADGDPDLAVGGTSIQVFLNQTTPSQVSRPGTADPVAFGSDVRPAGTPSGRGTSAPFFDFKIASGPTDVYLDLDAPAFAGADAWLVAEAEWTHCPPAPGGLPSVFAAGGFGTTVMGPWQLPADGHVHLMLPEDFGPSVQSRSGILQFVILSPLAANGVYAATEAHEIQF
jgi:hypothetical protein